MYKHILIPTDGSAASERAAKTGVELAKALGARVTAFYAAPPPTPVVYERGLPVGYLSPEKHAEAIARTAKQYLGVIERAGKTAGVAVQAVQATSDFPWEAILETAKKRRCDLIVMASHGRHGMVAVLLGSETQKVLAHATIPVLVHR